MTTTFLPWYSHQPIRALLLREEQEGHTPSPINPGERRPRRPLDEWYLLDIQPPRTMSDYNALARWVAAHLPDAAHAVTEGRTAFVIAVAATRRLCPYPCEHRIVTADEVEFVKWVMAATTLDPCPLTDDDRQQATAIVRARYVRPT